MLFKCSPNLKIFSREWFDYRDLSATVGYWSNFLKQRYSNSEDPIGIVPTGDSSFPSLAFFLALYESRTNFIYLPNYYDYTDYYYQQTYNLPKLQDLIILGVDISNQIKARPSVIKTADFHHSYKIFENPIYSPLEFEFSEDHKIITLSSGSTGTPKLIHSTAKDEARSISTAIREYFDPNDVCLFSHGLSHRGVHTTSFLPGLFSVDTIMLAEAYNWPSLVEKATHCQWFATMRAHCNLTPNLKKITFGGSILSESTADYIFSGSPDATVYDIYGLTECLPPVAIRKLTKDSRPDTFILCREDLSIDVKEDNILHITDNITSVNYPTGDRAEIVSATEFKFLGRDKKEVRVAGSLINQSVIISMLEKDFDSLSFSGAIKNGTLYLQVTSKENKKIITEWCATKLVEDFTVEVVERIITSGGIKTINQ